MTMLVITDPTPSAIAFEISPRAYAWTERCEDLSGLEIGRTHVPFLLANAEAVERGEPRVQCEIDGQRFEQDPFKYQHKCLQWLRDGYDALSNQDHLRVDRALQATGCERLFIAQ